MSSNLSSSSTDAQVRAAYQDNADYDEANSPAKARAFIVACRHLIQREDSSTSKANASFSKRIDLLQNELQDARKWLQANSTNVVDQYGPRFTRASFKNGGR